MSEYSPAREEGRKKYESIVVLASTRSPDVVAGKVALNLILVL